MKKTLIFYNSSDLRPIGGPCGYLYNLKCGLDKMKSNDIEVCFLNSPTSVTEFKNNARSSKNKVIILLFRLYKRLQHIKDILSIIFIKKKSPVDLNEYDAVHFHTTRDLYYLRKALKNFSGEIILTSHSPQPLSKEYYDGSSKLELFFFGWLYKKLIRMDRYAFETADYIIFPCETADEPYLNNWPEYKAIKNRKNDCFRYLLSGTIMANPRADRGSIRRKYDIPDDAFVVCYVGRHNSVKGYDKLINIFEPYISAQDNCYVLVAGSAGPLYPPKNEKWKEVGWTNDPHSIVLASDVFVLPNEETYFDLVLLEVLSIGTPVVASNTGGNKFFKSVNNLGIQIYDSNIDCIKMVDNIRSISNEEKERIIKSNKSLFANFFSVETFANNYIKLLSDILRN